MAIVLIWKILRTLFTVCLPFTATRAAPLSFFRIPYCQSAASNDRTPNLARGRVPHHLYQSKVNVLNRREVRNPKKKDLSETNCSYKVVIKHLAIPEDHFSSTAFPHGISQSTLIRPRFGCLFCFCSSTSGLRC